MVKEVENIDGSFCRGPEPEHLEREGWRGGGGVVAGFLSSLWSTELREY